MTLLAAVAYLERASGMRLFQAQKHHKLRCLEVAGSETPRRGILPRPRLPREEDTYKLLDLLLRSPSPGEALRDIAVQDDELTHLPGTSIQLRWCAARRQPG